MERAKSSRSSEEESENEGSWAKILGVRLRLKMESVGPTIPKSARKDPYVAEKHAVA